MTSSDPVAWLRAMMLIRSFENMLAAQRDHGFQLLSSGEEAVAVGLCAALDGDDQLLTGGRSIGPALARGVEPGRLMAELLGKSAGPNRGKAGRGHLADPGCGFFGAHAVVGGNISIAAGVALARQLAGAPGIVAVLFGDGACGEGIVHETLNMAAIWRLPLLFVCNNNQLSVATSRRAALAPKLLSDIARPFGIRSETVDGMNVTTVAAAAAAAAAHVRAGGGPAFLECVSWRFRRHSTTARETRSDAELAAMQAQCPIERQRAALLSAGQLHAADIEALEHDVAATVSAAMAAAQGAPFPSPAEALDDVY
jgi:pyruvate dehydrogenase E1 component alpha subunit